MQSSRAPSGPATSSCQAPGGIRTASPARDLARLAVDLEHAAALDDEVDLLRPRVVVALGRLARLERRLGEGLGGRVVELADRRAVLRRERLGVGEGSQLHARDRTRSSGAFGRRLSVRCSAGQAVACANSRGMASETRVERQIDRWVSRATNPRSAAIVIATVTTSITIVAGLSMTIVDHKAFPSVGSGLWSAVQTVTTVGYGDVVPVTIAGRLLASVVMLLGIGFVTVITAAITSSFVARSGIPLHGASAPTSDERLRAIDERLERIEAALTARSLAAHVEYARGRLRPSRTARRADSSFAIVTHAQTTVAITSAAGTATRPLAASRSSTPARRAPSATARTTAAKTSANVPASAATAETRPRGARPPTVRREPSARRARRRARPRRPGRATNERDRQPGGLEQREVDPVLVDDRRAADAARTGVQSGSRSRRRNRCRAARRRARR